jgi:predicted ATPase/DNA-binding SARP family transcriptional activator
LIELGILGPLEARRDGVSLELGPAQQRALLACLLLRPGEVVSRDVLVENLWGDDPPETAQHALEVYVSKLRRVLGKDVVETRAGGYALNLAAALVDATEFELLAARGRKELERDASAAAQTLRAALDLWRGPPLADVAYEEFAQGEISRLEELRASTFECCVDAELRLGRHRELLSELDAAVREQPQGERVRAQLMLALYRSGRQAEALETYADVRSILHEELGLEPGAELKELQRAILQQDPALEVEPAELRARRHLPAPATPFIGRRQERADLVSLFRERQARLVTLTGPGGSGKTRLALQAAHDLAAVYEDGVYFVDLAELRDPEYFEATVATALDVDDATPLAEYLSTRRLLLVLDNFEQVDPAAPSVGELLKGASQLAVLTTSRTALDIYGEHLITVPPLEPDDAVDLFVDRAAAAGRSLAPDESVSQVCTWLDRLPLAIELVAAQARELPPERLLDLLPARLEVAVRGPRDVPDRQRTLGRTIEWSYELLAAQERDVLARLGVFAGGFTLDAARAVCEAELTQLAALAAASLLVETNADEPRLTMLQTIREFAVTKLTASGTEQEARNRHAEYFRDLAARAEPELGGPGEELWLDRLEREHDNLRTALSWFAETGATRDELQTAIALRRFWLVRGHVHEARRRLGDALARGEGEAAELRAVALGAAAQFALTSGDDEQAKLLTDASLELFRANGDAGGIARSLTRLGDIAKAQGLNEEAGASYAEAIDVARQLGDAFALGGALTNAGSFELLLGNIDEAEALTRAALSAWREVQHTEGITIALFNLAITSVARGSVTEALSLLEEAFELALKLGWSSQIAAGLGTCATAALRGGDAERAARLLAAMDALLETLGIGPQPYGALAREEALAACRDTLTEQAFEAAQEAGRSLSTSEAIDEGLEGLRAAPTAKT